MTEIQEQIKQHTISTIRYCRVESSLWYSLNDVCQYLQQKKAVKNGHKLEFKIRQAILKKQTGTTQFNFNCLLSVTPFDDFFNWVHGELIHPCCLKSELSAVRETGIYHAIDFNNIEELERWIPDLYPLFKEVKLVELK